MPIAKIQLPDGRIGRFEVPEGTTPDQVMEFVQSGMGGGQAQPSGNAGKLGDSGATWGGLQQFAGGLTQGLGDEIMAATAAAKESLGGGLPFGQAYDQAKAAYQAQRGRYEQENPKAAAALDIAGQAAPWIAAAPLLPAASAPSMLGRAAQSAGMGAGIGSVSGFTNAEGDLADRAKGAALGGITGAAMGAASQPLVEGGAALVNRLANQAAQRQATNAAIKAAPSTQALRSAANTAFQDAKNLGVDIPMGQFSGTVDDIARTMQEEGIDKTLHPRATAILGRLEEAVMSNNPSQITTIRRLAKAVADSADPDERRLGKIMLGKIDDFAENMDAGPALQEARDLWRRFRGSEAIDDLMGKAELNAPNFSASGLENSIRTKFRQLANNDSAMRAFSPVEREAITRVAKGGPVENSLRMLGKFAPNGVISTVMSGGAGAAMGGPFGAVALPATGWAARQAATALTKRNADAARALIASGAGRAIPMPQMAIIPRGSESGMVRALMLGTVPGMGAYQAGRLDPMAQALGGQ